MYEHVHNMGMYMFLRPEPLRDSGIEVCIERKEEEVKFQDNLKSKKIITCQKEWGGLNGSQVGHRIKQSLLLFFNCLYTGKTGRRLP